MISIDYVLKNEYYIRIMKNAIFKIIRLDAIRNFLMNKKGSIHDLLEFVNNKIIEHDGQRIGIRIIQKNLKQLKSDKNLQIDKYRPSSEELKAKYGNKGEKQYSHKKKLVDLSRVLFFKLKEGSGFSEKLSLDEQKALSDAAIILSRFQGKVGFEMIDDVIDGLNDCNNLVDLALDNKISNQQNNAYRKKEYLKIKEALIENKVVSVQIQQRFSEKEKTIEFHPHHLKMWKNKWYAFGFVKELEYNPYVLPIDLLIKDVKFSNNKFIPSQIKYTNEYGPSFFDEIIGVTNYIEKPVENIILKVTNKDRYQRFESNRIHHSCEFDYKNYQIRLKVKINSELINFIMEHIDEVEVIEPLNLRNKLTEKLIKIPESYKTNL
jgi:hypothetical protein